MDITKNKLIAIIAIVILVITIIIVYVANPVSTNNYENANEDDYHVLVSNQQRYNYNSSIIPILLLGIDSNDQKDVLGQSDAIMLLLLDRNNKQIKLLNIPRDTMCDIRLFDSNGNDLGLDRQHLTLAYSYGKNPKHGCLLACEAVSRLFNNIPIVYYASIDLSLLNSLQDIVGDIEVEVPNDSAIDSNPEFYQGNTLSITNDNVETYLRYRDTNESFSNNDRIARQVSYLKSYYKELKNELENNHEKTIEKMYTMYRNMVTNIKYQQMLDFSDMLLTYQFDSDRNVYKLDGHDEIGKIHDEYIIDKKKLSSLTIELFYKEDTQ